MRIAVRLAHADTNTSVFEWLAVPLNLLHQWCEVISDEQELRKQQIERERKRKRY